MQLTISNPSLAIDAQIAVSKEETRYYLNGFHVHQAKVGIIIVSTDGHRLLAIHDPLGTIDGLVSPVKLAPWFLKEIGLLTRKHKHFIRLGVEGDVKSNVARITHVNESTLCEQRNVLIDGTFPDWQRVMPILDHNKPFVGATFNPAYLSDFAKLCPNKGEQGVCTYGNDARSPFLARVYGRQDAIGVIMPMREPSSARLPTWLDDDLIASKEILAIPKGAKEE